MTETKRLLRRRRRGFGALTMLFGALLAMGSLFLAVTAVSAHHTEYSTYRLCDGTWFGAGNYKGGTEERLVILDGVVINGVALTSAQTGGVFQPYNPATHGVTSPPSSGGLAWRGRSADFTIFSLSANGNFVGGPGKWTGSMKIFWPIGDHWEASRGPVPITEPSGPSNCAPNTATPSSTTVVENATPTKTVPANTPAKTSTPPACTPPGTQTPAGGSACTPTPVPPASTPTKPPCSNPGTATPPGGSQCTPAATVPVACYNGTGTPPSGATVCTPTPVTDVAGVKTPGPGAPLAGSGFTDSVSNANMLLPLLGLLAVTAGAAFLVLGRRSSDED